MNLFGLLNLNHRFHDLNPPNTAIHDIVASLYWIRREIRSFGGDSSRVTLGGESSGSVAAQIVNKFVKIRHLQLVPPLS
jgi:carboxylesterase type B